jgi:hypothetical protein
LEGVTVEDGFGNNDRSAIGTDLDSIIKAWNHREENEFKAKSSPSSITSALPFV